MFSDILLSIWPSLAEAHDTLFCSNKSVLMSHKDSEHLPVLQRHSSETADTFNSHMSRINCVFVLDWRSISLTEKVLICGGDNSEEMCCDHTE